MDCDGSYAPIAQNTECVIPLSTLTASPFALTAGEEVFAKIVATNVKGDSDDSLDGNGAVIITLPDAPINLAEDITQRTVSDLAVTWNSGASDGGSTIIDYRVTFSL